MAAAPPNCMTPHVEFEGSGSEHHADQLSGAAVEGGADGLAGLSPAGLHRARRAVEQAGDRPLIDAEIPHEMKQLAVFRRQIRDRFVKRRPAFEALRGSRRPFGVEGRCVGIAALGAEVRGMPGGVGVRTGVASGEVEQFPPHLRGRQEHDVARRLRPDLRERPMEPQRRVLKDVVGVVPAADAGKAVEHPACQHAKSRGTELEDRPAGREVAGREPFQAGGQERGSGVGGRHRT